MLQHRHGRHGNWTAQRAWALESGQLRKINESEKGEEWKELAPDGRKAKE